MTNFLRRIFILSLLTSLHFFSILSFGQNRTETDTFPALSYRIIKGATEGTWGYDIYSGKRRLIHQPVVPAMQFKQGFAKEEDARKVAILIVEKINNNIFPPTISLLELESIGVIPKTNK